MFFIFYFYTSISYEKKGKIIGFSLMENKLLVLYYKTKNDKKKISSVIIEGAKMTFNLKIIMFQVW